MGETRLMVLLLDKLDDGTFWAGVVPAKSGLSGIPRGIFRVPARVLDAMGCKNEFPQVFAKSAQAASRGARRWLRKAGAEEVTS